jgi:two-component system OmpR family sensor kinase
MNSPDRPFVLIHEASLAFIDMNGQYHLISEGRDGTKPPQLDRQQYSNVVQQRPGTRYQVVKSKGVEQLVVLCTVTSFKFRGPAQGIIEISTPTGPLKELLIRHC